EKLLAPASCLLGRCRPKHKSDEKVLNDLPLLEWIVRTTRVYERPLGGLDARPRALGEIVRLGDEPPCPRQPQVVAERLEGPNRRLRDRDQLARGHVGPCKKAQKSPLHECVRSEAIVTGCDRGV